MLEQMQLIEIHNVRKQEKRNTKLKLRQMKKKSIKHKE